MKSWGREIWEAKSLGHRPHEVTHGTGATLSRVKKETHDTLMNLERIFLSKLPPSAHILDVGIGPLARFAIEFARRKFQVTGVDISPASLKSAAEKIQAAQMPHVTLLNKDLTELAMTNQFEALFCFETFYHIPAHLSLLALENFHAALKPQGLACIKFSIRERTTVASLLFELGYFLIYSLTAPLLKLMGRPSFYVTVARHSSDEIEDMARRCGFEIVERENDVFVLKKKMVASQLNSPSGSK